jgi:hypothetical protein
MLVFKKNIYLNPLRSKSNSNIRELRDEEDLSPFPFHFIYQALFNAQSLFQEINEIKN